MTGWLPLTLLPSLVAAPKHRTPHAPNHYPDTLLGSKETTILLHNPRNTAVKTGMARKGHAGLGCILQFLVACARLQIYELCYLWCYLISCVAYSCRLRHYALTIVIKISLSPFHRQIARVSWRPHPNPSFNSSVPSVSQSTLLLKLEWDERQWRKQVRDVGGRCDRLLIWLFEKLSSNSVSEAVSVQRRRRIYFHGRPPVEVGGMRHQKCLFSRNAVSDDQGLPVAVS